jgi:hypothetical protein
VPAARHFGVGVLPYYPLANGLLTGQVRRDRPPRPGTRLHERPGLVTPERLDKVEALAKWAESAGRIPTGGRHRRVGSFTRLRISDRWGHQAGTGPRQRGRRRLATNTSGSGGHRRDRAAAGGERRIRVLDYRCSTDRARAASSGNTRTRSPASARASVVRIPNRASVARTYSASVSSPGAATATSSP